MTNDEYAEQAMKEWAEDEKKKNAQNREVLKIVKSKVSKKVFKDIKQTLIESENTYDYSIVDKPIGEFQTESYFKELQGQWVDQTTNGGYSGDDYAGTICVQISKTEYFKWHYSM